jgi:hypothetical protein
MSSVGDQFAFRTDDGRAETVWELDGFELAPTPIAPTFEAFLDRLLQLARHPDDLVAGAHERLGPLRAGHLLAITLPIHFGTENLLGRLLPMSARLVMTFAGDAVAEVERCRNQPIKGVTTVMDERGRPRLRLVG